MIVLRIYRLANWCYRHRIPLLPFVLKSFNRIIFAVVLPPSASVGRNVLFSYEGLGTVIHRRAVIGDNAIIGAGVTLGGRSGSEGVPVIGAGAIIGSGAKVIGAVRIGAYASIGANAVVLSDIPDFAVAVGVPAKVVRINRPEELPNYRAFERQ
ncbi:serine acetyltransferase [Duganella fentianensis]|uniref:serine O-acetyltransferase n=1 Tax=Duganella fentianensis TaxID=2692177 RepID=UPI0032B3074A